MAHANIFPNIFQLEMSEKKLFTVFRLGIRVLLINVVSVFLSPMFLRHSFLVVFCLLSLNVWL